MEKKICHYFCFITTSKWLVLSYQGLFSELWLMFLKVLTKSR